MLLTSPWDSPHIQRCQRNLHAFLRIVAVAPRETPDEHWSLILAIPPTYASPPVAGGEAVFGAPTFGEVYDANASGGGISQCILP